MHRWSAVLLVLGSGCANEPGLERACTEIGCDSGARFQVASFAEADIARLTGARIAVCLNATCWTGVIDAPPAPNDIAELGLSTSQPYVRVEIARTDPSGAVEVSVGVSALQHDLFSDGDVYSVSLVGADQTQLVQRSWSVTYRTWQPNGPECEPTCRSSVSTTEL